MLIFQFCCCCCCYCIYICVIVYNTIHTCLLHSMYAYAAQTMDMDTNIFSLWLQHAPIKSTMQMYISAALLITSCFALLSQQIACTFYGIINIHGFMGFTPKNQLAKESPNISSTMPLFHILESESAKIRHKIPPEAHIKNELR